MIGWQLWRSNLTLAISFPLVSSPCSRRSSRRHICSLSSVSGSIASSFSLFTWQLSKRYIKQVKYCSIRLLDCHKADSRIQRASMAIEDDKNGTEVDETISEAGLVRSFQIVVAATRECGIGKDGKLPWNLPSELKFFKKITSETVCSSKKNAVIMGRRTWESIPPKFRPLSGRLNVVLSRNRNAIIEQEAAPADLIVSKSFRDALQLLATSPYTELIESVFVIGGEQLFREAMSSPSCDAIHWTEIESTFQCDTFVPAFDCSLFRLWYASSPKLENNTRFVFATYVRTKPNCDNTHAKKENVCKNDSGKGASFSHYQFGSEIFSRSPPFIVRQHEEFQYLSLIEDIIKNGVNKGDRTGTGTFSKFGCQMRFNLRKSFPLFTTKRVFWRGVVEELLWFISGSTNAKVLQDKGINIWNGNASREYLDRVGLQHREEGDLGPVYGFQWRHFGAKYVDMHTDYSGQGVDQLANVIQTIKSNPNDRRIVLSAWNPADLQLMALPPCHMFAQFYVANGELSCQMYQRSCDVGLGVPFNVASYSLLTCIIAHVCDLLPGDFVHVLGDAHVYKNHVEPLQEQLLKVPKPFPTLRINTPNMDINSFKYADFKLIGYESHERIAMKMAV